jgi:hypothetical protein
LRPRAWAAALLLGAAAAAPAQQQAGIMLEGPLVQGGLVHGTAPAGTVALTLDGRPVPLAPGGRFVIGFDRDHGATSLLVAELAGGARLSRQLGVQPRTWRTQHVNIARRPGGPTEAFLRLRERELARIAAARAANSSSEGWRQRFIWPSRGRISGVFGSQRIYRGERASFHSGVDVAPGAGAPVVAPADGVARWRKALFSPMPWSMMRRFPSRLKAGGPASTTTPSAGATTGAPAPGATSTPLWKEARSPR